ncbi:hypothetical protein EVAR_76680_1 [Eumeta japonica]|uniref:Uncharacterized protein n=1 Tax=Eumeta variegata TaxID=151549 RepID=A0A4C1STC6_EUMVA|nr:hypothetical protein EVAR_76680_1 [Eumeta japonica]
MKGSGLDPALLSKIRQFETILEHNAEIKLNVPADRGVEQLSSLQVHTGDSGYSYACRFKLYGADPCVSGAVDRYRSSRGRYQSYVRRVVREGMVQMKVLHVEHCVRDLRSLDLGQKKHLPDFKLEATEGVGRFFPSVSPILIIGTLAKFGIEISLLGTAAPHKQRTTSTRKQDRRPTEGTVLRLTPQCILVKQELPRPSFVPLKPCVLPRPLPLPRRGRLDVVVFLDSAKNPVCRQKAVASHRESQNNFSHICWCVIFKLENQHMNHVRIFVLPSASISKKAQNFNSR